MDQETLLSLFVSLVCGFALGFEREYRQKSTGLRTVLLICLGATVFMLINRKLFPHLEHIASTVVTGIGFLGAGVIFKDKLTVRGLTTAAVIWMAAALGLAAGAGLYGLAFSSTALSLVVLIALHPLEGWIKQEHRPREVVLVFHSQQMDVDEFLKNLCQAHGVALHIQSYGKTNGCPQLSCRLSGPLDNQVRLFKALQHSPELKEVSGTQ